MTGISAETLRPISSDEHIAQSIETILTTALGSRVMREWFGVPEALIIGATMNRRNILRWWAVIWMALDLFEPRLRSARLEPVSASADGVFEAVISGVFVADGHLGFRQSRLFVSIQGNRVSVTSAA